MENASKALIIAGAILLGILIVGLGMYIYNQAVGAMEGINFDTQQIQSYNAKFEQYEEKQSGTSVISLCNEVRAHNATQTDNTLQISIKYGSDGSEKTEATLNDEVTFDNITTVKNKIKSGKTYMVTFKTAKSGRIMHIKIEDVN